MGEIKAGVTLMQDFCRPRTEKFQEYIDYMDREEAQRNNAITTYNLFNEYMGNPYKSTGLFTAEKDSLTLQEKKHLKKVFSIAQTNQSLMWQTVISFDNNWLQKNGIYDMKTKMLDERKLKAVTRKAINELLKNEGLDQAVWSASIHYNTDNIHVHIATVEPYPMRKKMMYQGKEEVRGKFKLSNINRCKSIMINEIMQTREMNLRINTIIRKDIVEKLKEKELTKDGEIKIKFLELCQKIPKNRINYGNKEMRQYRAMIDEISEKFLEVYSSEKYYELREILDRQSLLYTEAYGGDQGGDYKKNKLQELKEKMGNAVLKQAKDYIECMNNKVDEPNFGMKEKTNEEISIELAVLEETEDAFLINEQEQLFEEKENIEQVDETQEKEYDLRLSAKSRIDISEVLQKELEAAKTYLGRGTVFNELKRGSVDGIYDPEYADEKAWEKRMEGGNKTILEKDQCLARYISYLIKRKNLSPEQVVEHLKTGDHDYVKYPKTAKTIYTAIDKGLIPNVTRQDMKTVVATGIVTMKENSISLPECIRRCAGLRNGNSFKIQCKKNGEIILKKN